jgi:hypothetical protein
MKTTYAFAVVGLLATTACTPPTESTDISDEAAANAVAEDNGANDNTDQSADSAAEKQSSESKPAEVADTSHSPSKADADSKTAECKIKSHPADTEFKGECEFIPSGGGSFSVVRSSGEAFVDGITEFVLQLDTKTIAGFSARSDDGELNYLGSAEKSTVDAACWDAENYTVCAY